MIKSIRLQNFESHEDTLLEFGPGVNAIVGESDAGKSAVIRALLWAMTNRPAGDAFRRHGGGETAVTLTTDDGVEISRVKGKENKYVYELPGDGQKLELKAFGQDVPEEISRPLNILPINVQTQFDSHFLLPPVSPGEVARSLNEAVDLGVIDRAQSNVNRSIRETQQRLNFEEETRRKTQAALDGFGWIDSAEEGLKELERLQARIDGASRRESEVATLIYNSREVEKQLASVPDVGQALAEIDALISVARTIEKNEDLLAGVSQLIVRAARLQGDVQTLADRVKRDGEELDKMMPDVCPLCGQAVRR